MLKDPKGKSKYHIGNIKLLLTKLEGHTGEYWLNIVELKMERSEVHTKMTKVQYSSVWLGQAWLESSLSYGTRAMVVC